MKQHMPITEGYHQYTTDDVSWTFYILPNSLATIGYDECMITTNNWGSTPKNFKKFIV